MIDVPRSTILYQAQRLYGYQPTFHETYDPETGKHVADVVPDDPNEPRIRGEGSTRDSARGKLLLAIEAWLELEQAAAQTAEVRP